MLPDSNCGKLLGLATVCGRGLAASSEFPKYYPQFLKTGVNAVYLSCAFVDKLNIIRTSVLVNGLFNKNLKIKPI